MAAACDIQEGGPSLNDSNDLNNKVQLITSSNQSNEPGCEKSIQILQGSGNSEHSDIVPVITTANLPVFNSANIQVSCPPPDSHQVACIKVETAVQANDYDIERRSGRIPARKRVIPFKFRDYRNPELVDENAEKGDSDYDPESDFRPAKRLQVTNSPRKRGRPRKYPIPTVLHEITKGGDNIDPNSTKDLNFVVIHTIGKPESAVLNSQDNIVVSDGQEKCDHAGDRQEEVAGTQDIVNHTLKAESSLTNSAEPVGSDSQDKACGNEQDQYVIVRTSGQKRKNNSWKSNEYACATCHKVFSTKGNLKTHERIHCGEKPFNCDVGDCPKSFRNFESLRRHRLSHMGIKPFECSICHNKFSSNVCLQEHMSRHTDLKPHQCHICLRNFRQISCLRRHLITHSTEMPYTCQVCGRKFSQNMYLKSHMKRHTGERPFKCKQCEKAFAHQSDLNRHKIVHTGQKPYECEVCHTKFSDPSTKRRHEREHAGTKGYVCQLCFESFKRAGQLKAHLNRKHVLEKDEVQILRTNKGGLHFVFQGGEKDDPKISIGDGIDPNSQAKQKKIVKLIEDLNSSMVQHVQINLPPHDYSAPEGEPARPISANPEDLAAVETVVMETMQNDPSAQVINSVVTSTDTPMQTLPVSSYQNIEIQEPTVITIAEVLENGQLQTVQSKDEVPVEYLQIIEELAPDSLEQQIVEVHYQQSDNPPDEPLHREFPPASTPPAVQYTEDPKSPKSTPDIQNTSDDTSSVDYVNHPDFSSQQYYNWLSSFTELCKVMPMPLDVSLFQKISQVHKTLSDIMATPSGVVADKENFKILMNISKELNTIINEHLFYVMQNLDATEGKGEQPI